MALPRPLFRVPLALGLSTGVAAAGEPVVLPDFTPASTADAVLAVMLQEEAREALAGHGFLVIGPEEAAGTIKPGALDNCAVAPTCPTVALAMLPARIGIVVRIESKDDASFGRVEAWVEGEAAPVDVWEIPIISGEEYAFGMALVGVANTQSRRLGPPPPELLDQSQALVGAGEVQGPTRLVAGSRGVFEASGLGVDAWVDEVASHAGRVVLEVRGGVGLGDVDRSADVRVDVDDDLSASREWFQEGPARGSGLRLALAVGYAPLTWLEGTVGIGIQRGERRVGTSWSIEGEVQQSGGAEGGATQLAIEPRVRLIVPTGIAKPYAVAGLEARLFDRYQIDSSEVAYPEPPGGGFVGPVVGAGWMVDPTPLVGVLVEGTFAYHLGLRAGAAETGSLSVPRPALAESSGFTVVVAGGVQLRLR